MAKTSLFIDPNSSIDVKFWIGVHDGQLVGAIDKSSKIEGVEYDEYAASFREPNYRDIADLSDGAVAINTDGNYALSVNQVRLKRVVRLLKSWNLKDDNNKAVPVNEQNIEKLNPVVAFTLSAALENALGIFEQPEEEATEAAETA
tara:strand:+ start:300275 stop:300712 length:438 start_codon:yes stop_codon:yes gene_type:complete